MFRTALPLIVLAASLGTAGRVAAQAFPYDPYALGEDAAPALGPDGTIHWGTFYKSAALQQTYERLWSLGACRNTNRAITVPVAENKLVIDRLPEADFRGVVRGVAGTPAGGVVAFVREGEESVGSPPLVAQLHPAGVTRFTVTGATALDALRPGMTVRLTAEVDGRGRGRETVREVEIVTPAEDFQPDEVRPGRLDTVVGRVEHRRGSTLVLHVPAGRLRRLTVTLAPDATVRIDAARMDLVAAGDAIEVRGRLWSGAGSQGAGTVFASDIVVTKATVAPVAAGQPAG